MIPAKLRDLLYFVALLILLGFFSHGLTPFAPIDFQVMAKYHDKKVIGKREFRGRVYFERGRALTKRQETVEKWRGGLWNQQILADNVYEPEPVTFDHVYDELGFPNEPGRDNYTIACLGDSQTASGWPRTVEQTLNQSTGNFGVPALEPGYWKESLEAFVLSKKPNLVVIGLFNVRNRVEKVFYAGDIPSMPKSTLRRQIYWEKKYRLPLSFLDSPFGRFGIVALDRAKTARGIMKDLKPWRVFEARSQAAAGKTPRNLQIGSTTHRFLPSPHTLPFLYTPIREKYKRHVNQAITQVRGRCALEGIKTIMVFIPSKESIYMPYVLKAFNREEQLELLGVPEVDLPGFEKHYNEPTKLAEAIAKGLKLPFLDGSAVLTKALESGKKPWYVTDGHFSREGNGIYGREVARFIRALGPDILKRDKVVIGASPELRAVDGQIELSVGSVGEGKEFWIELDIEAKDPSDLSIAGALGSLSLRPIGGGMRTTYFLKYDGIVSATDRQLKISGMKRKTVIHGARLFALQ